MFGRVVAVSLVGLLAVSCGPPPQKTKKGAPANNGVVSNNGTASNNQTTVGSNNGGGTCGNGVVDAGESCDSAIDGGDGVCPNACPTPPGTCGTFELRGMPDDCSSRCELVPAACADGDDCCPVGCDASNDGDCTNACGNGIIEAPEVCDGDCPSDCEDGNACTVGTLAGDPANCSSSCSYATVTSCDDGDGCCPAGCNSQTDSDCSGGCGDGIIDSGETCDGDCPTSCDDGNSCTADVLTGSAAACSAACSSSQITSCTSGDGCCPSGCTSQTDSDCACIPTTSCAAQGFECGSTFNGCSNVSCGGCPSGETCQNNTCVDNFQAGTSCTSDGQCGSDGFCITESEGFLDGYCSRVCSSNSECGSGAHCLSSSNACFDTCTSNSQCRTGYVCYDNDSDGRRECLPGGTGTGRVGDACTDQSDCAGGQWGTCLDSARGAPGGYCLLACGSGQATCPSGSECVFLQTADGDFEICLDSCFSGSDCRSGYQCKLVGGSSANVCWP